MSSKNIVCNYCSEGLFKALFVNTKHLIGPIYGVTSALPSVVSNYTPTVMMYALVIGL